MRWETAVLSAMAWFWKQSRGHAETIPYHDGVSVEVGEQEFVASIHGIAVLLWSRFHRQPFTRGAARTARFDAFYEAVRMATSRLCQTRVGGTPLLRLLGPARTDVPGKASDAFGQRWTMEGSIVDQALSVLAPCGAPEILFDEDIERLYREIILWSQKGDQGESLGCPLPSTLCDNDYVQKSSDGKPVVDVARVYDVMTARDLDISGLLIEAAAKTGSLHWRERPVVALTWQRSRASGKGGGNAHLTIGAWRRGRATSSQRRDLTCAVPFLVADIDGQDLADSLSVVRSLLGRLVELGVRPNDLVVSYTGGRGFHVRIPHALLGRPLWPRARDVSRVLTRFFERLCEGLDGPDGPLFNSLDSSLFSPLHLVRAVGSEHEKAPGRRCVAFRGDEFLELVALLGDGVLDVVEAASVFRQARTFRLASPDRPAPVLALKELLRSAIRDVRYRAGSGGPPIVYRESRGIISSIRLGVRPGEEFAPNHVGRNRAALLYADYLLTHGRMSEAAAWAELKRWNAEMNPVPLGEAEGDEEGELERVFDRARRFVASLASGHESSWSDEP